MAVEIFHYDFIPQDKLAPAMKFLLTKWNTLSVMNKLTLQSITEHSSFNIPDNSAYMLTAGDDFFFMHMGVNVRAALGQDLTGRLMSTVNDTVARDLIDAYQQSVTQGKPIFLRFTSPIAQNALVWERLVLPVSVNKLGTILICFSEVTSHHQGIFEYLFKHARHPWLVTYPIFTGEHELDDGWVLLMNDAAHAAFHYDQPIGNLRLRELALFQFSELWAKLRERFLAANPRATVSFDQIELELIKVKQLVVYRFDKNDLADGTSS
jgi:hypothetical protein